MLSTFNFSQNIQVNELVLVNGNIADYKAIDVYLQDNLQ